MKTQKSSFTLFIVLSVITMLLWGCKPPSVIFPKKDGSVFLANPSVGLDTLQSYHVSFQQDVTGSVDGQPFEYHSHIELSRIPGEMDFTRELGGTEEPASNFHVITDGHTVYRLDTADQACQGEVGDLTVGETRDPASLLFPITGATNKGSDVVNQIQTTHYQFDQNDLNISDPKPEVNGELWIADQGGYVVKLTLVIAPPTNPTGKGKEIGQEWTYEISQVNAIDSIELPQGCLPVPVDIPATPDAIEVNRSSGILSYITASQASGVVDLYFEKLPPLGWETDQKKTEGDLTLPASLLFTKGDQKLVINIDNSTQGGLDVDVLVSTIGAMTTVFTATPGAVLPTTPAPIVDAAESGLPEDIPLYSGVTNMNKMGNVLMVTSFDPADSIVNFYLEKMPALEWSLMNSFVSDNSTLLMWQKQDTTISISVTSDSGKTNIVISQNLQ